MTQETTLNKIVHFDINNKTDIKVLNSLFVEYHNQNFYKNGKPKGQSFKTQDYHFFDNEKDYNTFMLKNEATPKCLSHIFLVIDEGLKYDKDFILKNLNKI